MAPRWSSRTYPRSNPLTRRSISASSLTALTRGQFQKMLKKRSLCVGVSLMGDFTVTAGVMAKAVDSSDVVYRMWVRIGAWSVLSLVSLSEALYYICSSPPRRTNGPNTFSLGSGSSKPPLLPPPTQRIRVAPAQIPITQSSIASSSPKASGLPLTCTTLSSTRLGGLTMELR